MSNRKRRVSPSGRNPDDDITAGLRRADRAVLRYLDEQTREDEDTCTASIPKIADACEISERQVQISAKRLIKAGLLERLGYDLSNPDRAKRGTMYRVLVRDERRGAAVGEGRSRSVKFLLFWSED